MFAVAVWVLQSTLARFDLGDLQAELAQLSARNLGLAVLFTALSFVALMGYEWSALGLIGRRLPFRELAVASFATQSIAHSTGFAFLIGATLRYNFYAERGLTITDVAKIQVFFTATFTLGVATLAGGVMLVEPWRLAAAVGLPAWLLRVGALTALLLVVGYVAWGAFFHRPLHWRGRALVLPDAGATLTQIFFGVADLLAVAAALHVLMPAGLGLSYAEVLAIFMASIVAGLMSHVPGSLGVFESAVILLVQPPEHLTLPLIGALLAFRGVYYLLPLVCGVIVLTAAEAHRWRDPLRRSLERFRLDLGPGTPSVISGLTFAAGQALLFAAMLPGRLAAPRPGDGVWGLADLAYGVEVGGGVALLMLARGLGTQLAHVWRWSFGFVLLGLGVAIVAGEPFLLKLALAVLALTLFACRGDFLSGAAVPAARRSGRTPHLSAPAWLLLAATLVAASGIWFLGRV